jgi:hypothetical protein
MRGRAELLVRDRFEGQIAGVGSTSGVRSVVGCWPVSPFGAFADVMVEDAAGHRVLLAPSASVADYVAATYAFDEVVVTPVSVAVQRTGWEVRAGDELVLDLRVGGTTVLGRLLRLVPRRVATSRQWASLVDPVARVVLRGVRTRGTALEGRREWYAATDLHAVTHLSGTWRGRDIGELAPVDPPCRFGFSSTPRTPAVTSVVTTVERVRPGRRWRRP